MEKISVVNFFFITTDSGFINSFFNHIIFFKNFKYVVLYNEDETPQFSYDEETGRGPSNWTNVDPDWFLCGNGTRQSPINFDKVTICPTLGPVNRNYTPANATLVNEGFEIVVEWNGDAGNITINGTVFTLKKSHWHTPSEHTLLGTSYPLELHLVHESSTGNKAVIGILYRNGPEPNPFLSTLLEQISALGNGTEEMKLGIVDPSKISFGTSRSYLRYDGSLTTPPCSENVTWTIIPEVQSVSSEQVQALKDAVDHEFEENARPIQQLNGRTVFINI
ncbi:hypothetical protein UlMin_006078 [Ulmus minor]